MCLLKGLASMCRLTNLKDPERKISNSIQVPELEIGLKVVGQLGVGRGYS